MRHNAALMQSTVLIAWELGGGIGHIAKARLIAEGLDDAGMKPAFAIRDVAHANSLLPLRYPVFQAPTMYGQLEGWPQAADYAELLLHAGFGDIGSLSSRVRAWIDLFNVTDARLLVADHAPTAVLAAKCAGLKTLLVGPGFSVPPPNWPRFRTWEKVDTQRLRRARDQVRSNVNRVLQGYQVAEVDDPSEMMPTDNAVLCTYRELDHYPHRVGDVDYVGPLLLEELGLQPEWPATGGLKIFAYLRHNLPGLEEVLTVLSETEAATIVRLDSIPTGLAKRWQSKSMVLSTSLYRLKEVALEADIVICSGSDTAQGLSIRGVPILGLPMQAEQRAAFIRLEELGVSRYWIAGEHNLSVLRGALAALVSKQVSAAVSGLNEKYKSHSVEGAIDRICCRARLLHGQ